MPPRHNPLKLNSLQLKTLAILQRLARSPHHATAPDEAGAVRVERFPSTHHDHLHVGDAVVSGRDATGLNNPAVFVALERRGLARLVEGAALVTAAGMAYDTGLEASLFHAASH